MVENPRRGRQSRNLTTNVPKILNLKSSSEQIFSKNCRWVPLSKQCIDNVFILIARIVFKAPTDKFNSAGTSFSVKYPILYFTQSISASFCQKKLIKQRLVSSNELLCFSTHDTAYCFFDAHLKC